MTTFAPTMYRGSRTLSIIEPGNPRIVISCVWLRESLHVTASTVHCSMTYANGCNSFFPSFVTKLRATTQLIVELHFTAVSRRRWKKDHCQNRLAGGALEKSGALSRVLHTAVSSGAEIYTMDLVIKAMSGRPHPQNSKCRLHPFRSIASRSPTLPNYYGSWTCKRFSMSSLNRH
jgi:hypothetical protein